MSASVLYTNFGGMLVHEDRGGVERTYVHDEMGNTRYLLDSSNVTDTYSYTPYGQVTHVGTSVTPFTFIGALGYFATGWSHLMSYVRARWYSRVSGSWGSVDPIWAWQKAYQYVDGKPAMYVDPDGMNPFCIGCAGCVGAAAIAAIAGCLGSPNLICCMAMAIASSPVLMGLLLACAVSCTLCIPGVLPWLQGLGAGIGSGLTTGGRLGLAGAGAGIPALGFGSGGSDYPCGTSYGTDCEGNLELCQEKHCRSPYPWYEPTCEGCYLMCKRMGWWPIGEPCNFYTWF